MANTRPFWNVLGISLYLLLLLLWGLSVFLTPGDKNMGEIYRIIYVHVPVAFAAFFSAFLLLVFSVLGLWKRSFGALFWGRACSEVGLLFTVLTLITGSIWGYPTWGTWWTWDARLTTTLILAILYGGYLLLYNSIPSKRQRLSVCSFLGVIIFINVIIVYKSVTWWRTLHQPPTFSKGAVLHGLGNESGTYRMCFGYIIAGGMAIMEKIEKPFLER